jgi:hypothetical protein
MDSRQLQAARLLGRGVLQIDVAREVGVSTKTIQRWAKTDDFEAEVQRARRDRDTGAIEGALNAVKRDGTPDWNVRLRAHAQLYGKKPPAPDAPTGEDGDEPDDREVTYAANLTPAERRDVDELFAKDRERAIVLDFETGRTLASRDSLPTGLAIVALSVVVPDSYLGPTVDL